MKTWRQKMQLCIAALAAVGVSGCAMAPVKVSELQVMPPSLLIAKKASRPLFIVLDPSKVPDSVVIPEDELKEIKVFELQTFVKRDLKRAMETFFDRVEIVAPDFKFPDGAYMRADVRIDKLTARVEKAMDAGNAANVAAQIFGEMTWAFALRPSEATEYLYSFAAASKGKYSMTHVSETPKLFASTFEVAISELLKGMTDKGVTERVTAL